MILLRRSGAGDAIIVDMTDDGIGEWSEHRRKLRPQLGSAPRAALGSCDRLGI
jgi:hypothetical protein